MAMILLHCPQCGNEIKIDETKNFCFCDECGKKIKIPKPEAPVEVPASEPAPEAPVEAPAAEPAPEAPVEEPMTEAAAPEAPAAEPVTEAPVEESAPVEEPVTEAPVEEPMTEAPVAEPVPVPPVEAPVKVPASEPPVKAPVTVPAPKAPAAAPAKEPPEVIPVPRPTGYAADLDALFKERRYAEAYEGYMRFLQVYPNDIRSLYRLGVCAVYLSEGNLFRTTELRSAVSAAVSAMSKTNDRSLAPEKDEDINTLLIYMTAHGVTFNDKLGTQEECASQATGWIALTGLYQTAVPFITSETVREEALKAGVDFCDRALHFKASYFTGTSQTKNGKTKEEYTGFSLDKKQRTALKDARTRMAESFNTLSSRTAEETRLNEDAALTEKTISKIRADIRRTEEKFKASRKVFLIDKPEIKMGRSKILRNSLIIGGIVVLGLGAFGFFALKKDKTFLFVLLMLLVAAFLYITFRVSRKSLREYEASQYPEELKALYDRLEDDAKQLRANRKHAVAAKDAVKKFNNSKL